MFMCSFYYFSSFSLLVDPHGLSQINDRLIDCTVGYIHAQYQTNRHPAASFWHCSNSMRQGLCNGTYLFVCLSVPSINHCSSVQRVAAVGPGDTDQQRQLPGAQQHGVQQHMQAVSCCQLTKEADNRLVLNMHWMCTDSWHNFLMKYHQIMKYIQPRQNDVHVLSSLSTCFVDPSH